jgi:hypothetical protein
MSSRRRLTWPGVLGGLVVLGLAIQVIRPSRTNPPVDPSRSLLSDEAVPVNVRALLRRSCADCHSSETVWPWYSNVAPFSWVLVSHVTVGRRHLSLSEWTDYDQTTALHHLEEMCEHVEDDEMPLPSYLWIHDEAALTDEDKGLLCGWTTQEARRQPTND